MNTPIYEELVEQFHGLTEGVEAEAPDDRVPTDDDDPGARSDPGETAIVAVEPTTACYWCGTPLWADSECHEWLATDPAGGESVPVTACSAEHLARLQAARGVDPEPARRTEYPPATEAVSGATTPMALPAPSAPTPVPPSLSEATEPLSLPSYRIATPVETDDDELAAEPVGESALFGPMPGPDDTGARSDVRHRVGS